MVLWIYMAEKVASSGMGLKIVIVVFAVAIVGLAGGIVAVKMTSGGPSSTGDSRVDAIMSKYQSKIDSATDNETKMQLYIDRAHDLKLNMQNYGGDQCEQIKSDLDEAIKYVKTAEDAKHINMIVGFCDGYHSHHEGKAGIDVE